MLEKGQPVVRPAVLRREAAANLRRVGYLVARAEALGPTLRGIFPAKHSFIN
jgi:hypothetical protein